MPKGELLHPNAGYLYLQVDVHRPRAVIGTQPTLARVLCSKEQRIRPDEVFVVIEAPA